ncbi:DUF4232 domain-containing protein [Streptomyces sp. NPDC085481]|uniref:DUF4232 domain-containing protein n=1 Tax=Streptomyces sp. NPDC085481 TaxID=3365727 RepID=UPI0037D6EB33
MRTTARRLALPVAALAASLALTACQADDDPSPAKPSPAAGRTSTAPTTEPSSDAKPSDGPGAQPTAAKTPAKTPAKPPAKPAKPAQRPSDTSDASDGGPVSRTCTAADTKVVVSKVSRPVNHLALTVTNTSGRPCNALGAPFVGFDDPQAPIRIIEDSKPQAVVTLLPGESAYASVVLTGEPGPDTNGHTVKKIRVYLTRESSTTVAAPSGTFADDGAAVSYWQRDLEDALTY